MNGKELWAKWKALVLFAIFGGLATILDTAIYYVLFSLLGLPNVFSAFLSWFLVVFFCFYTNKFLVYGEKNTEAKVVFKELCYFFLLRSTTGVLNIVAMYVLVDVLHFLPVLMKLLTAIVLGFVNYGVGKLAVFQKKE